ncbi:restriction endonuclease subunit S [Aerococcus tenax]|uniref:restriction endonuclease subunit S n=1 Tax=Aerococcus tenax TaxID=3078812 RepID=UPI001E5D91C3|nr:restriction endonuclease subunit S [Aerococcus tenax]
MTFKVKALKDIATVTMGQSPKSEYYNNEEKGIPFLQGVRTFGEIFPEIDTYTTKAAKIAEKGDILFTVRAPVGEVNIAPCNLCIGRGLAAISSNNQKFLYYLLKNNKSNYENFSTGTIYSSINKGTLENLEFLIPDEESCIKISDILYNLDQKIILNNKIIANLEAQAQAIFKSWFIDFEPFRDGEFIDSELGRIPEGWKVSTTGDEFIITYGKNLPTKKLLSNGYPVFGGNGKIGYYSEYLYEKPRILVSCRGAASGKVIISTPFSFITNNSLVFNEIEDEYFYYFINLFNNIEFETYVTGSAQPQLTISNSKNIKIIKPKIETIRAFNKICEPMFNLQYKLNQQNNILNTLRDTLLPKLMSGEIDVSQISID